MNSGDEYLRITREGMSKKFVRLKSVKLIQRKIHYNATARYDTIPNNVPKTLKPLGRSKTITNLVGKQRLKDVTITYLHGRYARLVIHDLDFLKRAEKLGLTNVKIVSIGGSFEFGVPNRLAISRTCQKFNEAGYKTKFISKTRFDADIAGAHFSFYPHRATILSCRYSSFKNTLENLTSLLVLVGIYECK